MRPWALVCHDDQVVRSCVAEACAAGGWEPAEAAGAGEALDLARSLTPDLVLVDVALAGLSVLEAIPRIRACSRTSRVVVLSAPAHALELCLAAGATAAVAAADAGGLEAVLSSLSPRVPAA